MRRVLVATTVAWSVFSLASAACAQEATDSGLPVVAPESQPSLERAPEPQPHPNDERWLKKPFSLALSAILGIPGPESGGQQADPFLMPGVELAYALPHVSFGGTLGYFFALNASLAARGRLHLGHAVALTLGARAAMLRVDDCSLSRTGDCEQWRHWDRGFFASGELGIEGRTEAGFMWRAQAGIWGLIAHGGGTCSTSDPTLGCSAGDPQPGLFITQELTVGWAF